MGPKPAIGDFLGDLTNEITPKHGLDSYVAKFVFELMKVNDFELMETERDIGLTDTDDESDNDF